MTRQRKQQQVDVNTQLYYAVCEIFQYWNDSNQSVGHNVSVLANYFINDVETTSFLFTELSSSLGKKSAEKYLKRCITQGMSEYLSS